VVVLVGVRREHGVDKVENAPGLRGSGEVVLSVVTHDGERSERGEEGKECGVMKETAATMVAGAENNTRSQMGD
jgi:hypothetical protein